MYKVKIINAITAQSLEDQINKFLAGKTDIDLIDIKYIDGEMSVSAMIIYKKG